MVTREMSQPLPKADYGQMEDPLSAFFRAFISMFDTRPSMPERASRTFTEPKQNIWEELAAGAPGESWPFRPEIEPDFDASLATAPAAKKPRTWAAETEAAPPPLPVRNPVQQELSAYENIPPISATQAETAMRDMLGLPSRNPLLHTQEAEQGVLPTMGNLQSFAELLAQPLPQPQPASRPLPPGYKQETVQARKVKKNGQSR